jgi:uncharacterized membrane protein
MDNPHIHSEHTEHSGGHSAHNEHSAPIHGHGHDSKPIEPAMDGRKLFGVLCYLGPLVIIPLLTKGEDKFIKFHTQQGLVLLLIQLILWFFKPALWPIWPVTKVIELGVIVLAIIGIVHVIRDQQKELPVVGGLGKHMDFL